MTDTYRLEVTYAAGNSNVHPGLTEEQLFDAVGAFTRDLVQLKGQGVRKLAIELEPVEQRTPGDITYAPPLGMRRVYECVHQRFITPCSHGCHGSDALLRRSDRCGERVGDWVCDEPAGHFPATHHRDSQVLGAD